MIRKNRLDSINQALHVFAEKDLKTASINLFDVLGFSSEANTGLSSPDKEGFDLFARQSPNYSSFNKEKALFDEWQEIHFLFQLTDDDIKYSSHISMFASEFRHDLYDSYLFFAIDLGEEPKAKYKLANITREINKLFPMPVLIIYKTKEYISIAIINRRFHKRDRDLHVLEKVTTIKDICINKQTHRAHIEILYEMSLFGLLEAGYPVNSFFALHSAWQHVLNTEELNKRFFESIKTWFYWARDTVRFPIGDDNSENARTENLIRLLTRMIFIWFIKEKDLVDKRLFDYDLIKEKYFNPDCFEHSMYYKAILQNLFFATLNNERNSDDPSFKRQFLPDIGAYNPGYKNQYYYRYARMFQSADDALELFESAPFLNGGLFECLDSIDSDFRKDFFTNPVKNKDLIYVPDELFFKPNNIKKPQGLIDIFKHYKFTVEENTPIEEEIALDPELLGKVFESLLSEWDSDHKVTKKKYTASYYTPREIVDYMVAEALITYLDTLCQKRGLKIYDKIKTLFEYSTMMPNLSLKETKILVELLSNVKILDPACGSGAFPMGMLHKIVYVLGKLDPLNTLFKKEQKAIAEKAIDEDIQRANKINDIDARNQAEEVLLQKMERLEEIFSEDNQEYFDYARKLYIIENCIYGVDIQPIAIQISKLRFFISLIIEQEKNVNKKNYGLISLPNLETKLIAANSLIPPDIQIKNEYYYKDIELLENRLRELRKKYFFSKNNKEKRQLKKTDAQLRQQILQVLKSHQVPEDIYAKIDWDPYESSKSAEFFDPFRMFSIEKDFEDEDMLEKQDKEPGYNKVFDIVIANPPFIRADNPAIKAQREIIKQSNYYETIWEKWDMYIPFLERSFKFLKLGGLISYIIPDAYIASKYAQKSHEYFLNNAVINRIDFLSDIKVFEAEVKNIILQIQNSTNPSNEPIRLVYANEFGNIDKELSGSQEDLGSDIFRPYSTTAIGDFENTTNWGNICYVSYGLRPSSDERYYKGEFKKDDLISATQDATHPLPYVEGKWISRYKIDKIMYLEWNTERSPRKLVRPTFEELYTPPKIMKGRMTDAIYDESGLRSNDSIIISTLWHYLRDVSNRSITSSIRKDFKPTRNLADFRETLENTSKDFDLKYLLAIINSSYAQYFLKTVRRSQIGIYPNDIKKIPVPIIDKDIQSKFVKIVDFIMFCKSSTDIIFAGFDNETIAYEFDKLLNFMVLELYFEKQCKEKELSFIAQTDTLIKSYANATDKVNVVFAFRELISRENQLRNDLILAEVRLERILNKVRGQ